MKKYLSISNCVLLLFVAAAFLGLPGDVLAKTSTISVNASGHSDMLVGLADVAGVLVKLFTFVALLMLDFFGELIGNEMLTGDPAIAAIRPMWVWIRNIANVGFVVALVALAFTNLFASFSDGDGNWTIKKKLPKIIIAMVAVNFSLLGFRVVIDAINVGTVAILGIADTRLEGPDSQQLNGLSEEHAWVQVSGKSNIYENAGVEPKSTYATGEKERVKDGASCTFLWQQEKGEIADLKTEKNVLKLEKVEGDKAEYFVCLNTAEQINRMFCGSYDEKYRKNIQGGAGIENVAENVARDSDCMMLIDTNRIAGAGTSTRRPETTTDLNLFMAFGTTFMHLERLPGLAANLDSLGGVIDNTLFAGILALAFLAALAAVFVALLARIVVLWVAMVFSPLLVGASILGFGASASEISNILTTHLVMPLKIAAAFAVSFVMVSAMLDFGVGSADGSTFVFGPALSQMGQNEYAILWQIATIVIFWKAAFWAVKDNLLASSITNHIQSGAEELAKYTARAATIDRQFFSVGTGEDKAPASLSTFLNAPKRIMQDQRNIRTKANTAALTKMGLLQDTELQTKLDDLKIAANKGLTGDVAVKELMAQISQKDLKNGEIAKYLASLPIFKEGTYKTTASDFMNDASLFTTGKLAFAAKSFKSSTGKSDVLTEEEEKEKKEHKFTVNKKTGVIDGWKDENGTTHDDVNITKDKLESFHGAEASAVDLEAIQGVDGWKGKSRGMVAAGVLKKTTEEKDDGSVGIVAPDADKNAFGVNLKTNAGALQVEMVHHQSGGGNTVLDIPAEIAAKLNENNEDWGKALQTMVDAVKKASDKTGVDTALAGLLEYVDTQKDGASGSASIKSSDKWNDTEKTEEQP